MEQKDNQRKLLPGKKNRRVFFLIPFLALFASCATPPFQTREARMVPEDFFGIAPYRRRVTREDFPLIDGLGLVWQRRTCSWSFVEPERGRWNFSEWDEYVEMSRSAGKRLLAILAYDTGWLYGGKKSPQKISARDLPLFLNYIETVVTRYRGKIDAYEIWNEPNMKGWEGSDEEFITMTRAAIKTIRSVDPDVTILAGAFWRVPKGLIRKMIRAGVFDEADGLSFHPYALSPAGAVRLCGALTEFLDEEGFTGEIWITETGYPTRGWYPTRVSEDEFPSHIVKTLSGLAVRKVRVLFWYELFDQNNPGKSGSGLNPENFFGVAYPDRSRKAGYNAFALCGKNLAGKEYRPEFPERKELPERTVTLCFLGKGENVLILWNERGSSYSAKIILPGIERRLYDIHSGTYTNMGRETELTVSRNPLFITWKEAPAGENSIPVPSVQRSK